MKYLIAFVVAFSTLTLNAKSTVVTGQDHSTVTTVSSHIDKKKSRRHKKTNRKRKRACHNWAKKSYAG